MVEYHPSSPKDQARIHQQVSFLGAHWSREEFGNEIFWLRIWKKWKSWTHQKFILEESTRKKYWCHQKETQSQMEQQNCQEETMNSEYPTQRRKPTVRSEVLSEKLEGESGEPQPTESKEDAEARADFWSIQGDFIYCHHNEPRVHLHVSKEETFPKNTSMLQGLLTLIWTSCKKNVLMTTGMSIRTEVCQIPGKESQNSLCWKRTSHWIYVIDKSSNDYDTRSCMAWSMGQNCESRQCSTERNLLYWSRRRRIQGNPFKFQWENWKGLWQRPCRAKRRFIPALGNW